MFQLLVRLQEKGNNVHRSFAETDTISAAAENQRTAVALSFNPAARLSPPVGSGRANLCRCCRFLAADVNIEESKGGRCAG